MIYIYETSLSQFVTSEDKATSLITREPNSERIKGLLRALSPIVNCSTAKIACKTTQRKHEHSHPSGPVRVFSEAIENWKLIG